MRVAASKFLNQAYVGKFRSQTISKKMRASTPEDVVEEIVAEL